MLTGSGQEFGQGGGANSAGAILVPNDIFGGSVHSDVAGDPKTQVGINGGAARWRSGLNLFADPSAVFGAFRPAMVSLATTSDGGQLRGLARWNVDLAVARNFQVTERWSATFSGQLLNAFNVVQLADPTVSVQAPQSFGVLGTQVNSPRIIQLWPHVDF